MLVSASRRNSLPRKVRDREDAIANTRDVCATLNAYAPQRASPARRRDHLSSITGHNPSHPAVPALPFREIVDRRKQIFAREIRPQLWRHIHLGIRKLPEQKIGNPHFTGGANQQVRVWIIPGVKMFAEHLRINHRPIDVTGLDFTQQAANSIDDLDRVRHN